MNCMICKHGELQPGETTVTLSKEDRVVIIKNVPALICDNCGESYTDEDITKQVFDIANQAAARGTELEIRNFQAAS